MSDPKQTNESSQARQSIAKDVGDTELSDLELDGVAGGGTGLGHKILRGLGAAWDGIRDATCRNHTDPSSGQEFTSSDERIGGCPHS